MYICVCRSFSIEREVVCCSAIYIEREKEVIKKIISELIDQYQIGVRVLGHLSYLPPDVQELAHKVMKQTEHNTE